MYISSSHSDLCVMCTKLVANTPMTSVTTHPTICIVAITNFPKYYMTEIYIFIVCFYVFVCIWEKWEIFTVTAPILACWLSDTDALKEVFFSLSKPLLQKDGEDMNASLKYTFA